MHLLTFVTSLAVVGVSVAWYKNKPSSDNENYGGWLPNRRSLHCVPTGGQCVNSLQCCSSGDQCLIKVREEYPALYKGEKLRSRFGQCYNLYSIMEAYEPDGFGVKKSGENCEDSIECVDQCCREIKKGRFGTITRTCGKPGPYTCLWRKHMISPNDIFGY